MASPPFQVKAVYEYSSPHDDDLSFPIGQVITVTEEEGDDWYYGEFADQNGSKQEGLFPRNFVKIYEPETPPRPSRPSRAKKETESSRASAEAVSNADPGTTAAPAPSEGYSNIERPIVEHAVQSTGHIESVNLTLPARQNSAATKPAFPASSKPAPPPSESAAKPTSGSFKDRINAFNKPAAPPVAPTKPSGLGSSSGSGFVKKAFVAPPPSKNAYVPIPREAPPQKVYRREEELEPEAQGQPTGEVELMSPPINQQTDENVDDDADQPKPTSLKERIALLQKQQMEQAARQADAAQRREKPKRPPKKRMESQERIVDREDNLEGDPLERVDSGDTVDKRSMDLPRAPTESRARSTAKGPESSEGTPLVSPTGPSRHFLSDPNDADMSGAADTEERGDTSTSQDETDTKLQGTSQLSSSKLPGIPTKEHSMGNEQNESDEEQEEEEEVDPEVKKRMEIRERMAKMSGGMGMTGMFGPPGGMAPMASRKQVPSSGERKSSGNERSAVAENTTSRAPPLPMMPMSGLAKVRSPEQDTTPKAEVTREDEEDTQMSVIQGRSPVEMPDVEDLKGEPVMPPQRSTERSFPPPVPHERPVPPLSPSHARGAPPPPPGARPVPPPPSESQSRQFIPPSQVLSPSEGSESDDEMSIRARNLSLRVPTSDDSRPVSREGPPPAPPGGQPPSLPSGPQQPPAQDLSGVASDEASPTSPVTPSVAAKRYSRPPPIPGASPALPPPNPQSRAPPPPPPTSAPPSRVATGDMRAPPPIPRAPALHDSEGEITEYEGDYDTDIASGASHKAALKSHSKETAKELDQEDDSENNAPHHAGFPPSETKSSLPSRAVPPPPPSQPPKGPRQSSEMPRAVPPPLPPPKELSHNDYEEEVHDHYDRPFPSQYAATAPNRRVPEEVTPSQVDDEDELYSTSPPQRNVPASPAVPSSQFASPPSLSTLNRPTARQSLDVQRTSTSGRRSMEGPRLSSDQGFIAGDIDLGYGSQWWTQPNMAPPVLQHRRDVIYEVEDSTASRRGGRQAVTRSVYVLYMDYSQTIIAAHFETKDPSEASLEQHHEPPPSRLRQDQLEDAHTRFGARIADAANSKKETTVGDGSPHGLVLDLIASLPDALRPVGVRAYGALVYANLANASVQQFDEIRSGDIITFRNARFQGHRGAMHSKYAVDIGKQDHVGIVVDWDGTKKKVRAWEQGRESRKVKMESFKLGDMRSGEVKVWRVMARQWVGWE
ncbi:MAG: hypothetical protein LQ343_002386 [Gyalolechia ehrenbergii]|nr:MAG: hypothetical protein LQ343_002386 [Gyalolechia ehrenbergii]